MREDPDAQCTRKQILMGQGRGRVNKQRDVVIQMISKQRYISRRQESSWREHGNRVETRKSDLRYNTKTQSTINNKGETNPGRGSHKLKTEKTNKHRYIKIQRPDLLDRGRKPETGYNRRNRKREPGNTNLND